MRLVKILSIVLIIIGVVLFFIPPIKQVAPDSLQAIILVIGLCVIPVITFARLVELITSPIKRLYFTFLMIVIVVVGGVFSSSMSMTDGQFTFIHWGITYLIVGVLCLILKPKTCIQIKAAS